MCVVSVVHDRWMHVRAYEIRSGAAAQQRQRRHSQFPLLPGPEHVPTVPIGTCIMSIATLPGWCCWSDEDYVGRIARLSRRCHPSTTVVRTLAKSLMAYRGEWARIYDLQS